MKAFSAVMLGLGALVLAASPDAFAGLKVTRGGKVTQTKVVKKKTNVSTSRGARVSATEKGAARIRLGTVSRGSRVTLVRDETRFAAEESEQRDNGKSRATTEIGSIKDSSVSGRVNQTTNVDKSTNIARGNGAEAHTNIGTIRDSVVSGRVDQTTTVKDNLNTADGKNAEAHTEVGTIRNTRVSGSLRQTTRVDSVTNEASGADSLAVTRIGTVRNSVVSGSVDQTTSVGSSVTRASGGGIAITHIGTIGGSTISGDSNQSTVVGETTNLAE